MFTIVIGVLFVHWNWILLLVHQTL